MLGEKFIRLSFVSYKLNVISGAREIIFIYSLLRGRKSFLISVEALNREDEEILQRYRLR